MSNIANNQNSNDITRTSLIHLEPRPIRGMYRFFCWCAGANRRVLEQFPTEINRYFGIGTAVFMTGVFAFISSTFALSSVFKNASSTLDFSFPFIVGFAWAFFIFFLDRFLVSSMKKSKDMNRWDEWKMALPRIILAILIGIVIARPLELRIFQDEILYHLSGKQATDLATVDSTFQVRIKEAEMNKNNAVGNAASTAGISEEERRLSDIDVLRKQKFTEVRALLDSVQCECRGACGTMKRGRGPACKTWETAYEQKNLEYNAANSRWILEEERIRGVIAGLGSEEARIKTDTRTRYDTIINNLKKDWDTRRKMINEGFATSLLARNTALSEMMESESGVFWVSLIISLLFIVIECAPIIVKIMAKRGSYEEAIEDIEYQHLSESRQRKILTRQELNVNKDLIDRMAFAQREIIRTAMEEWKNKRLDEIRDEDNNDNDFFNPENID